MADLKSPFWIWFKGIIFLATGILALALIVVHTASFYVTTLTLIAIWSFCRFYYFAFYVIEKYVDPEFKFSGLLDFARYSLRRRQD
ncbi:MAG: hypothetical protein AAGA30_03765 [Planctomycetota bacterium]